MNRLLSLNKIYPILPLTILSLFIFGLTFLAPVKTSDWDSKISLIVTQAIIEHHSIKLDPYWDRLEYDLSDNYRIEKIRGHHYYRYPIGTSIFSLPFVGAANLMGWNMAILEHEFAIQNLIAASLSAVIFVIIYQICRCYLSPTASLFIATVSVLGSALVSTIGTALWNLNFTVLFSLLAILHLTRYDTNRIKYLNPLLIALLLFAGYLCRPTAAFFSVVVLGYLLFKNRTTFFKTAGLLTIFLGGFITFNWLEFGRPLQAYYLPQSHLSTTPWLVALYGNLFSPSRGIFIFSPFFGLASVGFLWYFKSIRRQPLLWLALFWFCLHVSVISRNTPWWGGHSYGPRLLTDVIPALILVTIFVWQAISTQGNSRLKKPFVYGYLAFGIAGIFINSYQGLYNIQTIRWLRGVKEHPEYVFDWRYPQFLATEDSIRQRKLKTEQAELDNYLLGDSITYASDNAVLWDWAPSGTGWRWAKSQTPRITFKLGNINSAQPYRLEILAGSLEDTEIGITLNDAKIGNLKITAFADNPTFQPRFFTFDGKWLQSDSYNQITFHLPHVPASDNLQQSGVAFVYLKIYPANNNLESRNQ